MIEPLDKLFVYGSLQPGGANAHVLAHLGGNWTAGSVRGTLVDGGWGSSLGYPGLIPEASGETVDGQVLTSAALAEFWPELDEFEGAEYERRSITVVLRDGDEVEAQFYALNDTPMSEPISAVFAAYPPAIQSHLRRLRALIIRTAATVSGVGHLTETLKWGEPAYLTEETKSGSTIRLGWKKSAPDHYALYLNCQTSLVDTFRTRFPELTYQGNRAVVVHTLDPFPEAELSQCIEMALTYHARKKAKRG